MVFFEVSSFSFTETLRDDEIAQQMQQFFMRGSRVSADCLLHFCSHSSRSLHMQACQRYWTEGGMLRNVPVGAGRRKNKPTQARSQENGNTGLQPREGGTGQNTAYPTPGSVHTDYPPGSLCGLHQHDHAHGGAHSLEAHAGVPAGTLSAMAGTTALHGAHVLRYQAQDQCPSYHRCSHDPHASAHSLPAAPGRCPSCSQYLHATSGAEDSSRRVRPRLDEGSLHEHLPGQSNPTAGQGLLPGNPSQQGHLPGHPLLPQGKLPGSPTGASPTQQAMAVPGGPSGLISGPLSTPHSMHPPAAALPIHLSGGNTPQGSLYSGMTTAVPHPHDPSPSQSQPSLAATLAGYPNYRPPGAAVGLGMGMGMGALASQIPGQGMGYLGMGGSWPAGGCRHAASRGNGAIWMDEPGRGCGAASGGCPARTPSSAAACGSPAAASAGCQLPGESHALLHCRLAHT